MGNSILDCLRALKEALCPDGMIALQIGGIGKLPPTTEGELRITFVNHDRGGFQYVTLTDDEFEEPEALVVEIVNLMREQQAAHELDSVEE